jgi:hypothetical protein
MQLHVRADATIVELREGLIGASVGTSVRYRRRTETIVLQHLGRCDRLWALAMSLNVTLYGPVIGASYRF